MNGAHGKVSGVVTSERVDFGIITVGEDELEAVLECIPSYKRVRGRRIYNLCRLKTDEGDAYEIAVVRGLRSGIHEATELVRDLLEELDPRWVLVVGIAAGVEPVNLGDVVVSTWIADFSEEKVQPDGTRQYFAKGGAVAREAAIIIANLPALKGPMKGWNDLSLRPAGQPFPRAWTGVIASSDKLIRDPTVIHAWREQIKGIRAVEMESSGVFQLSSARNIPCILICGISTLITAGKGDVRRLYACEAAASFTAAFLRTRPIDPRKAEQSHEPMAVPQDESTLPARTHTPFRMDELTLTQVRGFDRLALSLASSQTDAEVGQWLIFLGPNGVGKTSILRALALSFSSEEVVQGLLGRLGNAAPMVRVGATQATIQIKCPNGYLPSTVLGRSETGDRLDERSGGDLTAPFTVAYGCRRGSALGGSSREVNASSPLSAVETLFDEGVGLVHAETWLKERKLAATLKPGSADESFFNAIISTLKELLPGISEVRVNADRVEAEGPSVGCIPLGALSDGYLTTTGWVLDLIARWAEDAKRRGIALDGSFRARMTGVAIIDEIDLHLHPRWQRNVIADVRRLFPRMSFVVTTHNPLTLLGAKPGEIFVLRREEPSGRITALQRDLPPGLGAEGVLTGDWFDLASTLDDDTLKLLDQHRVFLHAGQENTPEAKDLEEQLSKRLGSYAATSIERLALSAAAQVLDEDTRSLGADAREAARAKIVELLRTPVPVPPSEKRRRTRKGS